MSGAGYIKRKPKLDLDCLNEMSMPIRGTVKEDQTTEKCRARKHLWYVRTRRYTPRERPEPESPSPAEIEAAVALIRREKQLLRAVGRRQ